MTNLSVRMIAFRYLSSKRKESFISVISIFSFFGVALGVGALIVVMAVMNGFHIDLMDKILGTNGHITIQSIGKPISNYEQLSKKAMSVEGVTQAFPIVESQIMASAKNKNIGALVKGMNEFDLTQKSSIADNIVVGKIENFSHGDNVILGVELAMNLGIFVGDRITLISPQASQTVLGLIPRHKVYNVVALFSAGIYQYDSSVIIMPIESAQKMFSLNDAVNKIEIFTNDANNSSVIASQISQLLPSELRVLDWQSANSHLFNALQVERTVMFLILTLIIIVAAFNIISSLTMLVKDKTHDVAILRTIGASRSMILQIFFICGSVIGVSGTLFGVILGIGFAANIEKIKAFFESMTGTELFDPVIYFLTKIPAHIVISDVVKVVLISLILCFVATIYPAWKASRLEPIEALRYE